MKINDLQDCNKGKLGFVIGAGPSLHFQDIELLRDYITIAVNSAIVKANFFDYFLSDDQAVRHWQYFYDLSKLKCICLLYDKKLKGYTKHIKSDRIVWFTHKCWYDPSKRTYNSEGLILTKDAQKPIVGSRTSSGSGIHMAYIMGINPIVLLGHDCCFHKGKRYFWQFPGEKKTCRISGGPVIIYANKGKVSGQPVDNHSLDFLYYWENFSKQSKSQNINIINASGGILDSFPRMSIKEVLEQYGDRKR